LVNIEKPPSGLEPTLYNYLYQLAEYLSLQPWAHGDKDVSETQAAGKKASEEEVLGSQYDAIRSLIIKTADTIRVKESIEGLLASVGDLNSKLSKEYVAVGQFGTYLERLNAEISVNPEAIEQYYKFFSELKANVDAIIADFADYRIETEGYIRTGIVDYDSTGVPIFGVAVGQNLSTVEVDGETVVEKKNFRATYTASKLSFWQDAVEVAYVSNNQLYIANIIALGKVTIGKWDIDPANGLAFKWIGG
jgi:hypothetical protein